MLNKLYVVPFLAAISLAAAPPTAPAPAPLTFDDKGAQVGQQLPDLALVTIDKEPITLGNSAGRSLTLIVTSSFTCPKSRSNYPALADLAEKYKDKINIAILYVIEAHPAGDPSPYRNGNEDVTPENTRDGILRRQPTTLDKRLTLASDFVTRMGGPNVRLPLMIDSMDNWAWKCVGSGPNMAILVDGNRTVVARQGWFNAATLTPLLDKALAEVAARTQGVSLLEKPGSLFTKMVADKDIESGWDAPHLVEDAQSDKLQALLKKYPELATYVFPFQARGDMGGETLLQTAAAADHPAAVKFLLEHGADAGQTTPHRAGALYRAAEKGNDAVIKLLLPKVKSVDARYQNGPTPLEAALYNEKPKTAELLIAGGAKQTFFTQVASGNLAAVKAALAKDDSLAIRPDGAWHSPLAYAAANGQTEMVRLLNSAGSGILNAVADRDAVPNAIQHHHAESLTALLKLGADPNVTVFWQGSALHMAVSEKDATMVDLLLQAHANPNVSDIYGHAPLHDASYFGNVRMIQLLLAAGAEVNAQTGSESLPCGPGVPTATLETSLHFAANSKSAEAVNTLLAAHADVNTQDVEWRNALHHALLQNDPSKEIVQALINAKTPINAEDMDGKSPLDYAEALKVPEITKMLTDAGAKKGSGQKKPRNEKQPAKLGGE